MLRSRPGIPSLATPSLDCRPPLVRCVRYNSRFGLGFDMTSRSLVALLGCLLWPASAQQSQSVSSGPQTDLRISTTTQLVVEDVLIKGKDGKPVLGLKPEDFSITEDGK